MRHLFTTKVKLLLFIVFLTILALICSYESMVLNEGTVSVEEEVNEGD